MEGLCSNSPSSNFLLKYSLGLLNHITELMQSSIATKSISSKMETLKSVETFCRLIGDRISGIVPPLMGILQHSLSHVELRSASISAWAVFIECLPIDALKPVYFQIFAILIDADSICDDNHRNTMVQMIQSHLTTRAVAFGSYIPRLPMLPDHPAWSCIKQTVKELWSPSRNTWQHIDDLLGYISLENMPIVRVGLQEIRSVLKAHELQIQDAFLEEYFNPSLNRLYEALFSVCYKFGTLQEEIGLLCCECLGCLGALDPARISISFHNNIQFDSKCDLTSEHDMLLFSANLIEHHLAPAFLSASGQRQGHLAFAIQEILRINLFTTDILRIASEVVLKSRKPQQSDQILSRVKRWKQFPERIAMAITPLIESRYSVKSNPSITSAVKFSSTNHKEWIVAWTIKLIGQIFNPSLVMLFSTCVHLIQNGDTHLARTLLPQIFLNVLIYNHDALEELSHECLNVLLAEVSNEQQQISSQVIFDLVDHMYKWTKSKKLELAKERFVIARSKANNDSRNAACDFLDSNIRFVELFLTRIPQLQMSEAAIRSKAFARATLHYEQHIRIERKQKSKIEMQPHYVQLQVLYAELEDSDAQNGLFTMFINPALEQQIIHHESLGNWSLAQSCYEILLQKKSKKVDHHIGLLRCLKNLRQYESLITNVNGIVSLYPESAKEVYPYAVSASWRLCDMTNLKLYLDRDVSDRFESKLGRMIHHLFSEDHAAFSIELKIARKSLIPYISAASVDSYSRGYGTTAKLSILYELEQICNSIFLPGNVSNLENLLGICESRTRCLIPSLRIREPVLTLRNTLLQLYRTLKGTGQGSLVDSVISDFKGKTLIQLSREARKGGYFQNSYSAILLAVQENASAGFYERAKWAWAQGHGHDAMNDLKMSLNSNSTESLSQSAKTNENLLFSKVLKA